MTLYRALKSLQTKRGLIPAGDFISSTAMPPAALAKLEEVGALAVLHAPPLSELPDFEGAEPLATIGIVNADQLLEADSGKIIERLNIDVTTFHAWCVEVSNWLIIPARAAGG